MPVADLRFGLAAHPAAIFREPVLGFPSRGRIPHMRPADHPRAIVSPGRLA